MIEPVFQVRDEWRVPKHICVSTGSSPRNFATLTTRRNWQTARHISTICNVGYHAKFDRRWSNRMSVSMEIPWKSWILRIPPFKLFKVIKTDMDRSGIYDFLLTFHEHILYTVSKYSGILAWNCDFCLTHVYWASPLRGFSWNCVTVLGLRKKLEW